MFELEYGEAAVEVLDILDHTNKSDLDKIPSDFVKFLVEIASEDYKVYFNHSKQISEMKLKEKTKELLGVIYINWWCDKEEKENYIKQIRELEKKRQEEINKKYNLDRIFENREKLQMASEPMEDINRQNQVLTSIKYEKNSFGNICHQILNSFRK